jgi:hypothetical protein
VATSSVSEIVMVRDHGITGLGVVVVVLSFVALADHMRHQAALGFVIGIAMIVVKEWLVWRRKS